MNGLLQMTFVMSISKPKGGASENSDPENIGKVMIRSCVTDCGIYSFPNVAQNL